MNGPVIKAAQKALETGDIKHVLIWVKKKDESKIEKAFKETLSARKENPKDVKKTDMRFFEALVRIHREGEGAPYEGIKPAETKIEPGIALADKAVETGSAEKLARELSNKVSVEIKEKFADLIGKKKNMGKSVEAGREYVESYVTFIHFVEKIHMDLSGKAEHHD